MLNARTATILSSILFLGACTHYSDNLAALDNKMKTQPATMAYGVSPQDIAPAAGGTGPNMLPQYLAREYYDLARYENDKAYDYKAAKNYTNKAVIASKGQMTIPAKISSYDLAPEKAKELSVARSELITALKTQNTPENAGTLAKAQSRFDCWIEREEEAADTSHAATCKSEFEGAMAMLVIPAAGEASTAYDIHFAADSGIVDEAGKKTLEYVSVFLKAPENAAYTAQLVGGNVRTAVVRDILIEKGIDPLRFSPVSAPEVPSVKIILVAPEAVTTIHNPNSTTIVTPNSVTTKTYVPIDPVVVSKPH